MMADNWTWRSDKNLTEPLPIVVNGETLYPPYHSELRGKQVETRIVYDVNGQPKVYYKIVQGGV